MKVIESKLRNETWKLPVTVHGSSGQILNDILKITMLPLKIPLLSEFIFIRCSMVRVVRLGKKSMNNMIKLYGLEEKIKWYTSLACVP